MNMSSYNVHFMNSAEKEESLTLGILEAIEKNEDVTQRNLASDLGVALGLANSYLKRCARKGLIKVRLAPANRYLYYLTPKGFSEKSRLSAKYLYTSFEFYRKASNSFSEIYRDCLERQCKKILFCGLSELTEIAFIRAQEFDVELSGIWDPNNSAKNHLGLTVWTHWEDIPAYDICLLTSIEKASEIYAELMLRKDKASVLVPSILGFGNSEL